MRLTSSDIIALHRPTPWALCVYLRQQGVEEAEPSAFEEVLRVLGERHEREHLESLGPYADLSAVPPDQRPQRTAEDIRDRKSAIYQGELAIDTALNPERMKNSLRHAYLAA